MSCLKPVLILGLASLALSLVTRAAPADYIRMQLEAREERVAELGDEIKRLDAKIERNLDRLEQRFLSVKDSRESQITVQKTKEELIQKLGELAKYYAEQRDLFIMESQRIDPRADQETLEKVAQAYDKHIDQRIEQITRLSQSLASPHPDSKQGRDKQLARRTREMKEETQKVLRDIIDSLEKQNTELRGRISSMGEHEKMVAESQIEHNEALIDQRERQLDEMMDGKQISAQPVSKSEALQLRKLLDTAAQDIKEDSIRLSNLAIEYAKEEQAVKRLKEQRGAHPDDGHSH